MKGNQSGLGGNPQPSSGNWETFSLQPLHAGLQATKVNFFPISIYVWPCTYSHWAVNNELLLLLNCSSVWLEVRRNENKPLPGHMKDFKIVVASKSIGALHLKVRAGGVLPERVHVQCVKQHSCKNITCHTCVFWALQPSMLLHSRLNIYYQWVMHDTYSNKNKGMY